MSTELLDNSHPDAPQGDPLPPEQNSSEQASPAKAHSRPTAAIPMVAAFALALACAEPCLSAAKASSLIGPAILCSLLAGLALRGPSRMKHQRTIAAVALAASLGALAWLGHGAWASWGALQTDGRDQVLAEMLRRLLWALPAWAGLLALATTRALFPLWLLLCILGAAAIALGIPASFAPP